MPIYEYQCECGAEFESLERMGTVREVCGDLCKRGLGTGKVERMLSAPGIRGDGKEAEAPCFNPVKRAARPGCDDCSCDG